MVEQIAGIAGEALANKLINSKSKNNVFTNIFAYTKLLLSDPEKMDAHLYVENGELVAVITPDRDDFKPGRKARQIVLKINTREVGDGD